VPEVGVLGGWRLPLTVLRIRQLNLLDCTAGRQGIDVATLWPPDFQPDPEFSAERLDVHDILDVPSGSLAFESMIAVRL
jgi:hypothetical protein